MSCQKKASSVCGRGRESGLACERLDQGERLDIDAVIGGADVLVNAPSQTVLMKSARRRSPSAAAARRRRLAQQDEVGGVEQAMLV
jgi:hypothetical protein